MTQEKINISIISHNQANIVKNLLRDLEKIENINEILITINTKEDIQELRKFKKFPIYFITNKEVKGFGENHNYAFNSSTCDYFVIINPDVRIKKICFKDLIKYFNIDNTFLLSPKAVDESNHMQDNAREFPSLITPILRKLNFLQKNKYNDSHDYNEVDWVSGMFMIMKSENFKNIGMFDSKFFMYYEDVDLCKRIKISGGKTLRINTQTVIHVGNHQSHKSFKFFYIHLKSMLYYHIKYLFK